jgi:hypothetical protein
MMKNRASSGRNAHGCNLVLVSAYTGDILLDPFERSMLVPETDIWSSLPLYCRTRQEAIDANLGESNWNQCNEKNIPCSWQQQILCYHQTVSQTDESFYLALVDFEENMRSIPLVLGSLSCNDC